MGVGVGVGEVVVLLCCYDHALRVRQLVLLEMIWVYWWCCRVVVEEPG